MKVAVTGNTLIVRTQIMDFLRVIRVFITVKYHILAMSGVFLKDFCIVTPSFHSTAPNVCHQMFLFINKMQKYE